jgi:dTDP-4-amino-4,6-dideoxygalactose transaminase
MGDIGCFSFYPTKNLGAIGDGGGIITNDVNIYERLRCIRQYGWDKNRISQEPGVVSRLDELQAAILRVKLKYLDSDNQKRRNIAERYKNLLTDWGIRFPKDRADCSHVYHLYVIRTSNRDVLKTKLFNIGIEAGIHYSHPVHLHPGYANKVVIARDGLAVTEKIINEILTMPIYPELDVEDLARRLEVIK